jgi:hypothetical protein
LYSSIEKDHIQIIPESNSLVLYKLIAHIAQQLTKTYIKMMMATATAAPTNVEIVSPPVAGLVPEVDAEAVTALVSSISLVGAKVAALSTALVGA